MSSEISGPESKVLLYLFYQESATVTTLGSLFQKVDATIERLIKQGRIKMIGRHPAQLELTASFRHSEQMQALLQKKRESDQRTQQRKQSQRSHTFLYGREKAYQIGLEVTHDPSVLPQGLRIVDTPAGSRPEVASQQRRPVAAAATITKSTASRRSSTLTTDLQEASPTPPQKVDKSLPGEIVQQPPQPKTPKSKRSRRPKFTQRQIRLLNTIPDHLAYKQTPQTLQDLETVFCYRETREVLEYLIFNGIVKPTLQGYVLGQAKFRRKSTLPASDTSC